MLRFKVVHKLFTYFPPAPIPMGPINSFEWICQAAHRTLTPWPFILINLFVVHAETEFENYNFHLEMQKEKKRKYFPSASGKCFYAFGNVFFIGQCKSHTETEFPAWTWGWEKWEKENKQCKTGNYCKTFDCIHIPSIPTPLPSSNNQMEENQSDGKQTYNHFLYQEKNPLTHRRFQYGPQTYTHTPTFFSFISREIKRR